ESNDDSEHQRHTVFPRAVRLQDVLDSHGSNTICGMSAGNNTPALHVCRQPPGARPSSARLGLAPPTLGWAGSLRRCPDYLTTRISRTKAAGGARLYASLGRTKGASQAPTPHLHAQRGSVP